ncbi:MAG: hypothetical protein ACR2F6_02165 [Mycobacteriales bacterium]
MSVTRLIWRLRTAVYVLAGRLRRSADRGDIPGWVLVTLMSAVLAVAIIASFKGPMLSALNRAINSIK